MTCPPFAIDKVIVTDYHLKGKKKFKMEGEIMKINLDCVRDILISIEEYPEPMKLYINDFAKRLPKYGLKEIYYCCLRLYEGGYINSNSEGFINSEYHTTTIGDLTFFGHEFLANIKNDTIWNKVKNVAFKVGSYSFDAITKISAGIIDKDILSCISINQKN